MQNIETQNDDVYNDSSVDHNSVHKSKLLAILPWIEHQTSYAVASLLKILVSNGLFGYYCMIRYRPKNEPLLSTILSFMLGASQT